MLAVVESASNNEVQASTGLTPYYVNSIPYPRVLLMLLLCGSDINEGECADIIADISPATMH